MLEFHFKIITTGTCIQRKRGKSPDTNNINVGDGETSLSQRGEGLGWGQRQTIFSLLVNYLHSRNKTTFVGIDCQGRLCGLTGLWKLSKHPDCIETINREDKTREKHLKNKWVVRAGQSALVLSLDLAITILLASGNTDIGTARWARSWQIQGFTTFYLWSHFVILLPKLRHVGNNFQKKIISSWKELYLSQVSTTSLLTIWK